MHLGFLIPPFAGHMRPASVLARELVQRGHRVRILSLPDGLRQVSSKEFEFTSFGEKAFPLGKWDRRTASLGASEGRQIYRQVFKLLLDHSKCIASDLPNVLAGLKLDGLVMDQLCYGAEALAEKFGTPLAVACNALPFHRESRVPLCFRPWDYNPALWARIRNKVEGAVSILVGWRMSVLCLKERRALGLRPPKLADINEVPPSLAQITQIPWFFDFPRHQLPDHFHYTAPWIESPTDRQAEMPWDRIGGKAFIYASLGTLQNRVTRWYEMIAEACAQLRVQLVVGLGRDVDEKNELETILADRAIVMRFAPQHALMSHAPLVITHAGLNSALEALSAGVPIMTIPIAHDQAGVAARLRRLGVALTIPARRLTVPDLTAAISRLLNNPQFSSHSRLSADRLRPLNGPKMAADILETAFQTRARVQRIPC
jgi:zeaxanthin glucosyltransferase